MKYHTRTFYTDTQKSEMWDPSRRCKHRLSAVDGCAGNLYITLAFLDDHPAAVLDALH